MTSYKEYVGKGRYSHQETPKRLEDNVGVRRGRTVWYPTHLSYKGRFAASRFLCLATAKANYRSIKTEGYYAKTKTTGFDSLIEIFTLGLARSETFQCFAARPKAEYNLPLLLIENKNGYYGNSLKYFAVPVTTYRQGELGLNQMPPKGTALMAGLPDPMWAGKPPGRIVGMLDKDVIVMFDEKGHGKVRGYNLLEKIAIRLVRFGKKEIIAPDKVTKPTSASAKHPRTLELEKELEEAFVGKTEGAILPLPTNKIQIKISAYQRSLLNTFSLFGQEITKEALLRHFQLMDGRTPRSPQKALKKLAAKGYITITEKDGKQYLKITLHGRKALESAPVEG